MPGTPLGTGAKMVSNEDSPAFMKLSVVRKKDASKQPRYQSKDATMMSSMEKSQMTSEILGWEELTQ